ncbi:MAG: AtpZ/AtpI family protein [Phycisphaerales bacterium]
MSAGWALMAVGWEFVSEVVAGLLIGWGIDYFFNTRPWGIIGGVVAGLLVGISTFIRRALSIQRSLGPVVRPPGGWASESPHRGDDDSDADGTDDDPGNRP